MTHDEFRQQYEAYPWDPYQPLAVILSSGERVYIDMPEQVRLTPDELVITRRSSPRKPERYRYADIARLVPLLELPADPGGISYAEFDPLIRELLMAEPFQPFAIELKNGERIELHERGGTTRAGRFIALLPELPKALRSVNFDQVARLTRLTPAAAGRD
jgi:hypothetical protein